MNRFVVSPTALQDMSEINDFYATRNAAAGLEIWRALYERFDLLTRLLRYGRPRDEIRKGFRSSLVGDYTVFYQIVNGDVVIQAVIHQSRDLRAIFRKR